MYIIMYMLGCTFNAHYNVHSMYIIMYMLGCTFNAHYNVHSMFITMYIVMNNTMYIKCTVKCSPQCSTTSNVHCACTTNHVQWHLHPMYITCSKNVGFVLQILTYKSKSQQSKTVSNLYRKRWHYNAVISV